MANTKHEDAIKEASILAKGTRSVTVEKSMTILYTLADKFLEGVNAK